MKKAIFLFAATLLLCNGMKAQELADASTLQPSFQLSLSEPQQAGVNSIYALPMPTSDFAANSTDQLASRKGWGVACIISGGLTMLSGASVWLFGGMFSDVSNQVSQQAGEDAKEFNQASETVSSTVKTVGIIGTVVGAALVGTGIWLVSSDGNSSGGSRGGSRGNYRSKRRFSDNAPSRDMQPDWGLCLNVGPAQAGLTFVF